MIDPNVARLLGGYATKTLTDSERSALFEAALSDQELFNALHDEQALQDLLQDTESRWAIQRALKEPVPQPRRAWLVPAWGWGLGGSALASVALIYGLLLVRPRHDQLLVTAAKPVGADFPSEAAARRRDPTSEVGRAGLPSGGTPGRLVHRKTAEPSTRPTETRAPSPAAVLSEATPSQQGPIPHAISDRLTDGQSAGQSPGAPAQSAFRASPAGYQASSSVSSGKLSYSILKRRPDGSFGAVAPGDELRAGDSVQLSLHTPVSGSLVLQEEGAGGAWKTVFPVQGGALPVSAQREVVLPDAPLQVDGPRHLRLVLTPFPVPESIVLSRAAKSAVAQNKQRVQEADIATEMQVLQGALVTDVTLTPGKTSAGR
ncbi:MAG: hypothetical protein M3Z32_11270 [Acidobacteriota bacterium]|nr:hypothetical protein [Acidobacteriota bacterium]